MGIEFDDAKLMGNLARMRRAMEPVGIGSHIVLLAGPINQWFQARAAARFKSEGDRASGKWKQLERATWSWRRRSGFPEKHPINVRTGDLKTLLTEEKPNIGHDGVGSFLLWPGGGQNRGRRPEKMRQAAGQVRRRDGSPGTARPVVAWDLVDVAFVHRSFQTFIMTGKQVTR